MKRTYKIKIDRMYKLHNKIKVCYSVYYRENNELYVNGSGISILEFLQHWFEIYFKNDFTIRF